MSDLPEKPTDDRHRLRMRNEDFEFEALGVGGLLLVAFVITVIAICTVAFGPEAIVAIIRAWRGN